MKDQPWVKFLEVVRKKLSADDARVEIGGRPPAGDQAVWMPIDEHRRLVVLFSGAPDERAGVAERLEALLTGFRETLDEVPSLPAPRAQPQPNRELDDALSALGSRTGAETVWIVDHSSPVVWASSEVLPAGLDLAALTRAAEADALIEKTALAWPELLTDPPPRAQEKLLSSGLGRSQLNVIDRELPILRGLVELGGLNAATRRLRSARALCAVRERSSHERPRNRTELRGPEIQCFAHILAGQYQLVLVFDETYSPLHAEGHVQRALPHVERLLLSLPPIDPGGARRAKVIPLARKG